MPILFCTHICSPLFSIIIYVLFFSILLNVVQAWNVTIQRKDAAVACVLGEGVNPC